MGHANSKIATDVYIQLSDSYQSKQNTKTLDEATACGVYIFEPTRRQGRQRFDI